MKTFWELKEELNERIDDREATIIEETADKVARYQALAKKHDKHEGDHQFKQYDHIDAQDDHADKRQKYHPRAGGDPATRRKNADHHEKGHYKHGVAADVHGKASSAHAAAIDHAKKAAEAHEKHGSDHVKTKTAEKSYRAAAKNARNLSSRAEFASMDARAHTKRGPQHESTQLHKSYKDR